MTKSRDQLPVLLPSYTLPDSVLRRVRHTPSLHDRSIQVDCWFVECWKRCSGGLGVEPIGHLEMPALAGKAGRSLALLCRVVVPGAVRQQKLSEIAAVGRSCGEDRSETARLRCVGVGSMFEQHRDRLDISP